MHLYDYNDPDVSGPNLFAVILVVGGVLLVTYPITFLLAYFGAIRHKFGPLQRANDVAGSQILVGCMFFVFSVMLTFTLFLLRFVLLLLLDKLKLVHQAGTLVPPWGTAATLVIHVAAQIFVWAMSIKATAPPMEAGDKQG